MKMGKYNVGVASSSYGSYQVSWKSVYWFRIWSGHTQIYRRTHTHRGHLRIQLFFSWSKISRQYVIPNRHYAFTNLHSVTSQKIGILMLNALRTSNIFVSPPVHIKVCQLLIFCFNSSLYESIFQRYILVSAKNTLHVSPFCFISS
jgi:hypothetical protein